MRVLGRRAAVGAASSDASGPSPSGRGFISYRRDDSRWQARPIQEAFCRVVPRDHVFMDIDSIPPGANFRKVLKDWVDGCDVLLALIGPGWIDATDPRTGRRRLENASDFVRIEIGEALARDIPVVPVLLDGAPMPDSDGAPRDGSAWVDGGDSSRRVARGGSWGNGPQRLRSASRIRYSTPERGGFLGVRLARTLKL